MTAEELFSTAVFSAQNDEETPKLDPEVELMRLREAAERHLQADAGPRFRVGDVVTPSSDSNVRGSGRPHIVIAVNLLATHNFDYGDRNTPSFGCRNDMRIICLSQDRIVPFWVESAEFVSWTRC